MQAHAVTVQERSDQPCALAISCNVTFSLKDHIIIVVAWAVVFAKQLWGLLSGLVLSNKHFESGPIGPTNVPPMTLSVWKLTSLHVVTMLILLAVENYSLSILKSTVVVIPCDTAHQICRKPVGMVQPPMKMLSLCKRIRNAIYLYCLLIQSYLLIM